MNARGVYRGHVNPPGTECLSESLFVQLSHTSEE